MITGKQDQNIEAVIQALLDNSQLFPEKLLPFFSDISREDLDQLKKIWPMIAFERKINLLSDLDEMIAEDTLLSCDGLAKFALTDQFPEVRAAAMPLLWDCNDPKLAATFIKMLENSESELVQISSAEALGKFVLLGELEEVPAETFELSIEALKTKLSTKPSELLRQELVKSLAYASQPEINKLIEDAAKNPDPSWQLAAIIAMARSANTRWEKHILNFLETGTPEQQKGAVVAAGELALSSAREALIQLLEDEDDDSELRLNIIWALSKIGGDSVKAFLQDLLEESDDDEETEIIEAALDEIDFWSQLPDLDL